MLLMAILAVLLAGAGGAEAEATASRAVLSNLLSRLRPVLARHYPKAQTQMRGDVLEIEHDTRVFLVHLPLKTGEWQEAREMRGPNRHGVLCTIELRDGPYVGAAVLPQTFDNRYFQTLVFAEASPDHSRHLYVHLSYPDTVRPGFLAEVRGAVGAVWKEGR